MSRNIGALSKFRRYPGRFVPLTQFGTWNGTATSAQLVDQVGNPINSAQPSAIYRTDWQGRQLLYPTARTQLVKNTGVANLNTGGAVNTITGPDGTPISLFTQDTSTGVHECYETSVVTAGYPYIFFIDLKNNGINYIGGYINNVAFPSSGFQIDLLTSVVSSVYGITYVDSIPLSDGYTRYVFTAPVASSNDGTCYLVTFGLNAIGGSSSYTGDGTSGFYVRWDFKVGDILSSFIANSTNAPLTLTDYTLNGTGVTFAQAPASTATTDWDGVYV